jgi:hypothetical protein
LQVFVVFQAHDLGQSELVQLLGLLLEQQLRFVFKLKQERVFALNDLGYFVGARAHLVHVQSYVKLFEV